MGGSSGDRSVSTRANHPSQPLTGQPFCSAQAHITPRGRVPSSNSQMRKVQAVRDFVCAYHKPGSRSQSGPQGPTVAITHTKPWQWNSLEKILQNSIKTSFISSSLLQIIHRVEFFNLCQLAHTESEHRTRQKSASIQDHSPPPGMSSYVLRFEDAECHYLLSMKPPSQ